MTRVLVIMAMEAEAGPVRVALGLDETPSPLHAAFPARLWSDDELAVAICGTDARFDVDAIGTQPAVVTTLLACDHHRPDLLVSAGTAGGFAGRGGRIGDVFLSTDPLVFHDRRIPLGPFEAYGVGSYPTIGTVELAAAIGARPGVITTGNSLDAPPVDLATMIAAEADAKDMEAAAVGWVAEQFGIDFVAVKSITDLVDSPEPTAEQFGRNFDLATRRLAETLPRLLAQL